MQMRVLGGREGPPAGELHRFGQQSAEQNLDETLIEDHRRRRWWLWSRHYHFPCAAHQKTAFSMVRENSSTAASRKRSGGKGCY